MVFKCINCGAIQKESNRFCEVCGDNVIEVKIAEPVGEFVEGSVSENKINDKVEDLKKDLEDDGKRNYSHDPKRKSPGRPKKGKK